MLLPQTLESTLELVTSDVQSLSKIFTYAHNFIYMGRGVNYPTALEGALKLKEISYIHSEAYASGELKHGTISLVTDGVPVVALATQENLLSKTMSNIKEIKARGGNVFLICREDFAPSAKEADFLIRLPKLQQDLYMPVLSAAALQLFAYNMAVLRGCDVDKPRNLAKSVTVE